MLTLFHSPTFAAFVLASIVLALTPGPAVVYIVTRTLAQGRGAGLASVAGIALGNLGNAAGAALGLAALFAISSAAFTVVKFAGAAYLMFLGFRALKARPDKHPDAPREIRHGRLFRDGFLVALLNPKTALFFAALLPQFIVPSAPALNQTLGLGGVFVAVALCTDTFYVLTASAIGGAVGRFVGDRPYGRYVTAASFFGLGLFAAFAPKRLPG